MPASRTASSAALLALLAGCATLNKNECLRADWYAIGLEDGARGQARRLDVESELVEESRDHDQMAVGGDR